MKLIHLSIWSQQLITRETKVVSYKNRMIKFDVFRKQFITDMRL